MMKKKLFCILSAIIVCSVCHADFLMKVGADDTSLTIGETTTIRVYGLAEEAVAGNGLGDWSVRAVASNLGILQVNSATLLEPAPIDGISGTTLNDGGVGNILASAAVQYGYATDAGVAYTELFKFDVEAIAIGNVQYSLEQIVGDLVDFTVMYDDGSGNVTFDSGNSVGQISVVPEPSSVLILSGLGVIGYLRRKK